MKLNIRFIAILALLAAFMGINGKASDRNAWLTAQAMGLMGDGTIPQIYQLKMANWEASNAKQLRIMGAEDQNGAYQSLIQFDTEGNIDRMEIPGDEVTLLFQYTNQGNLRKIDALQKARKIGQFNYYYDRTGMLTRSVYDAFEKKMQMEVWYDKYDNPIIQHTFTKGKLTSQAEIRNTYSAQGLLLRQEVGKNSQENVYNAEGKLIQVKLNQGGKITQLDFTYADGSVKEIKEYKVSGDQFLPLSTRTFNYAKDGKMTEEVVSYADGGILPVVQKYNHDETWELSASMRGEGEFDVTYGYGTPVIIKWVTPEKDLRVLDSSQTLRLDLKPGIAQEMPEIVDITLRHNGHMTERKIGNVVLRKQGKGDNYFIEEKLPMMLGPNQITLEVETQLGKFSSDDRFITFQDPNALVKGKKLHVLAIGISDYEAEGYDAKFADADARDFSGALMANEGKLFEKVEVKTLTNAEATRENIREALRLLKGKSSEDDVAMVFFSGQGESFDGKFYLRTYDSGKDYLSLEASAIDAKWLAEELNAFRSPVAAFIDASQHIIQGETPATELTSEIGIVKDNFKELITDDEAMRLVLLASQGEQKSIESAEYSNGVFAETLLAALSGEGNADRNSDGILTFDEITRYVKSEVKERTEYKQAPTSFEAGIGKLAIGHK